MMTFQEKINKRKKEIETVEKLKQKYEQLVNEIKSDDLFEILPNWIKNKFGILEEDVDVNG